MYLVCVIDNMWTSVDHTTHFSEPKGHAQFTSTAQYNLS